MPEALALACARSRCRRSSATTGGPEGAVVETYAGLYCGMVGRYDEALQRSTRRSPASPRDRQAVWIAVASNHKAQLLIDLGQFARARQALDYERAADRPRAGAPRRRRGAHRARARPRRARRCSTRRCALLGPAPTRTSACTCCSTRRRQRPGAGARSAATRCCRGARARVRRRRDEGAHAARARAQPRRRSVDAAAAAMRDACGVARDGAAGRPVPRPGVVAAPRRCSRRAATATQATDGARAAARLGAAQRALPNVPEAFRDSFLHRNPTNRALLAAAGRRLGLHVAAGASITPG